MQVLWIENATILDGIPFEENVSEIQKFSHAMTSEHVLLNVDQNELKLRSTKGRKSEIVAFNFVFEDMILYNSYR